MRFSELAGRLDRLEATRARNELVRILAEIYQDADPDDVEPVTYLIQGRLAPFFVPVEIGLGDRLLLTAITTAFGAGKDEAQAHYRRRGDLGMTAYELAAARPSPDVGPVVLDVHRRLLEVAALSGTGSQLSKLELYSRLLAELDPVAAKHLVRITLGKTRLGIGDPTVLDALSLTKRGDRSLRPLLEGAYNRTSDLGLIARLLLSSGEAAIEALKVTVGRPLRPQLAERLPSPEAVIRKLGLVGVQPKYDGLRVQIHKRGDEVSIFSRNLETMTAMFPELVAAARGLATQSVILDGEAIAYDPATEEYVPFHATTTRRRKEGVEELARTVPLRAFVFDVMYRDGVDLTPLPYQERYGIAKEVIGRSDILVAASLTKTDSSDTLTAELLDYISQGLEGVVVKRLDSPYQAGARNFNWVKLKRNTSGQLTDTIDVVLIGYYRGKGKRAEFGAGALLAGVYDAERDVYRSISKLGTGLSDEGWRTLHERLRPLESAARPARVDSLLVPDVWLEPELVVEVLADEITPSPRHTAGMDGSQPGFALRFPRIVSIRSADKRPEDGTTTREIREMYEQQRQRPGRSPSR